jgi:hypothetical protein
MTLFTPSGKEYPRKWDVLLQWNMLNTSKNVCTNKILQMETSTENTWTSDYTYSKKWHGSRYKKRSSFVQTSPQSSSVTQIHKVQHCSKNTKFDTGVHQRLCAKTSKTPMLVSIYLGKFSVTHELKATSTQVQRSNSNLFLKISGFISS